MSPQDAPARFDDRVDDYVRYRPGYPPSVVALLGGECGLGRGSDVADVGSGTGRLTELLLSTGARVYAVEPNRRMRSAAERLLGGASGFVSVDGRAESTGLAGASVDLVTAAQAFHWFDPAAARAEFLRILRPGSQVALVWNERDETASTFQQDYEAVCRRCSMDYAEVDHRQTASRERIGAFFGAGRFRVADFPNWQDLDLAGLQGRYFSSSYAPPRGHPRHGEAMDELAAVFQRHQQGGRVRIDYRTRVYLGRPD